MVSLYDTLGIDMDNGEIVQRDYSKLIFVGIDNTGGISTRGMLMFDEGRDEYSIFLDQEPVRVPVDAFTRDYDRVQNKVREIKSDWKYRTLINFDDTKLRELEKQLGAMQPAMDLVCPNFEKPKFLFGQ